MRNWLIAELLIMSAILTGTMTGIFVLELAILPATYWVTKNTNFVYIVAYGVIIYYITCNMTYWSLKRFYMQPKESIKRKDNLVLQRPFISVFLESAINPVHIIIYGITGRRL